MITKRVELKAEHWKLAEAFAHQYRAGKARDVGAVEVGIIDILDSVAALYAKVLPRICGLSDPTADDLLVELVDLRMELEHIDSHARLALRGIGRLEKQLRAVNDSVGVGANNE